ncbi:MAG TPA: hypothetical protein VFJ71_02320 [Candidatus Limnocylindrales bacterium]|nr:hypothetical protein [Candidatus Limnocylindrales bacterium]
MADKQHADPDEPAEPSAPLTERVGDLLGDAVGAVRGRAAGVVGTAVDIAQDAARRWDERPGARVRRVRRLGATPLPYLYAVHPEARQASPRELGLKTIDVDLIAGTAVGGATQRGSDFLPLKPFRSQNWQARWQRIRLASDRLTILPPIDVLLYRGRYWVLDGHNRVAMALYAGQVGIDANVVELVPPGAKPSERSGALAAVLTESRALRSAGEGHRVVGIDELPERDDDPDPERQRQ